MNVRSGARKQTATQEEMDFWKTKVVTLEAQVQEMRECMTALSKQVELATDRVTDNKVVYSFLLLLKFNFYLFISL